MPSSDHPERDIKTALLQILNSASVNPNGSVTYDLEDQLLRCQSYLDGEEGALDGANLQRIFAQILIRLHQDDVEQRRKTQSLQAKLKHIENTVLGGENRRLDPNAKALVKYIRDISKKIPKLFLRNKGVNAQEYLTANPDVREAGISPSKHFLHHGADEGRLPINLQAHYPECFDPLEQAIDIATLYQLPKPLFPEDVPAILKENARDLIAQKSPKISVIIPTWNRAYSILPAIHSALAQTLQPYDIIVVDDGSTDGTIDLLNWKFSDAIQSGILRVIEQEHCGVSQTRNTGLEACQGDFIAYLDSDNIWHQDHLLYLATGLFQRNDAQICYGAYHRHDLDRQYSQIEYTPFDREALETENFIDLNTVLHTRDLYQKCSGFDTNMTRLVDWDFLLRLTQDHSPVQSPVISVDYFISQKKLMNISTVESLEDNIVILKSKAHTSTA